jgi:hypothetical protein
VTAGMLVSSSSPSLFDPISVESTLDDLVCAAWEGLRAHRTVDCPVCGEDLKPDYGVHARPIGGSCAGCGSTLR